MNYENYIYQQPIDPVRQAILLAMTQSMEQEKNDPGAARHGD